MLEMSTNIYSNGVDGGYESAAGSVSNSRRNSIGFKEYVRNRRYTMLSRPNYQSSSASSAYPITLTSDNSRKTSSTDSNFCDVPTDLDDEPSPRPMFQRRMSVPEKVFLSAEYAILRASKEADARFEIVAAFDRHTDPYRHYMQSLTCYDLQPNHSALVIIDGNLPIHKALTALCQCGHQAAVVMNTESRDGLGILTNTDCLRAIYLAAEGIQKVADLTVAQFLKNNNKKHLVYTDVNTSVWDAARLIVLNRVHRIPIIVQHEDADSKPSYQGEICYTLSLRSVFMETILKLSDPKMSLGPHIKQKTLCDRKVGTWRNIILLKTTSTVLEAVDKFLECHVSNIPIIDSDGKLAAVLSKNDIMAELPRHPHNYLEILDMPLSEIIQLNPATATTTMTIYETIALIVSQERQSVVVVDVEKKPIAVVSCSDIMDYIQNCSDLCHKASVA
ncbi:unnamed protein product [Auanema sp. JU1783]|nr:unnamed protein product [Auanema sp. JU1783]